MRNKSMCVYCNSRLTLNKDKMCHFCRVKFKGVKTFSEHKEGKIK